MCKLFLLHLIFERKTEYCSLNLLNGDEEAGACMPVFWPHNGKRWGKKKKDECFVFSADESNIYPS
jgi:hypothetical protein